MMITHPQRWRRLLCSDGCPIRGPPPAGSQALAAASTLWPVSSAAASLEAAPGTSCAACEGAAVSRAAADREARMPRW
jgi:hypothetical protein